jgi:ankyrin repeat protein
MKKLFKKILFGLCITMLSSVHTMQLPELAKQSFNLIKNNRLFTAAALTATGIALYYRYTEPKEKTNPVAKKVGGVKFSQLPEHAFTSQNRLNDLLVEHILAGDSNQVSNLLENGAHPNHTTKFGESVLIEASRYSGKAYIAIIKKLLAHGSFTDTRDHKGMNALMIACEQNDTEKALLLLQYYNKKDIDTINNKGETALMLAASHGNAQIITELIKQGADIHKTNPYGETALLYCLSNPVSDIRGLKKILTFKASVDCMNRDNSTALSLAVQNHTPEITQLIIDRYPDTPQINPLLKNNFGYTILEEAEMNEKRIEGHLRLIIDFYIFSLPRE